MGDQIDIGRLTSDEGYRQELRHRMQTDLYWLAKYVLGYDRISEKYHREAINLFVKKDPSKPLREQTRKRRRILLMPRKTYKALALDTRIPTPDGFTTMGKIKVGDTVFGEDGKPCKVVGCSPVYTSRTCYQLEFSTGETVTADAGHLWITDARRDRDNRKNRRDHGGRSQPYPQIRTTEEIAATVNIRRENNHRIKLAAPLDLPDVDLPISPYVLGCWLGDGHSNAGRITCGEKELVDEILAEGEVIRECSYKSSYGYVFNGGEGHVDYRQRSGKPFQSRIRNLNLLGNKHIPALYLRASYHQRLALLQGLMDTDGNAAKRDGQVVFCNTNLRLCKEVRELVNSLGIKARIQGPYDANLNGKKAGSFWQVAFKPYDDTRIFRLERKQSLLRPRATVPRQNYRTVTSVKKIDSVPVKCIMVDSPNQLFLITDGFIPTHNSTLAICDCVQWIICFPEIAIMVMTAGNSADQPLADTFVAEVVSHFLCLEGEPKTPLQICFPKHCVHKRPYAGTFTTPARTRYRRDPTVKAVSIEQSLSGAHPDLIKSEDVQDNRNSQTVFALRKLRKNFYLNMKMLGEDSLGVDITATRYGPADLYGDMIQKAGEETAIVWKPAYIRKPHALKLEDDELTEEDVILQFPEQLSWAFLREEKALDEETFWTQYMNTAEGAFVPTFAIERLEAAKIEAPVIETEDNIWIAWRFEYAESKHAACAVGILQDGRMTVTEVVRAIYAPSELARKVVTVARRWECHRVEIEDTPGARSMWEAIRTRAMAEDWWLDVVWSEFLKDETARVLAVKAAEPQLVAGRLLFADSIPRIADVFRSLYHYGMTEEVEIASVVARIASKLPFAAAEGYEDASGEAWQEMMARDAYNRVYGPSEEQEEVSEIEVEEEEVPENDWMPGLSGW